MEFPNFELVDELTQNAVDYFADQMVTVYDYYFGENNNNANVPHVLPAFYSGKTLFIGNVWQYNSDAPASYNAPFVTYFQASSDPQFSPFFTQWKFTPSYSEFTGSESNKAILYSMAEQMSSTFLTVNYSPNTVFPVFYTNANYPKIESWDSSNNPYIFSYNSNMRHIGQGITRIQIQYLETINTNYPNYGWVDRSSLYVPLVATINITNSNSNIYSSFPNSKQFTASDGMTYTLKYSNYGIALPFEGKNLTYNDIRNAINEIFKEGDTNITYPSYNYAKYETEYYIPHSNDLPELPELPSLDDINNYTTFEIGDYLKPFIASFNFVYSALNQLGIVAVVLATVMIKFIIRKIKGR